MANTHNQPFSQVLQTATLIDQIISSWTPQQVEMWATGNPQSVEFVINDYGHCLITHPGFYTASPQDQQAARDVFESHWENFGQYVNPQTVQTILIDVAGPVDLDSIDAIISNITDNQELAMSQFDWWFVLDRVAFAPSAKPEITQDEANTLLREMMENLNSNQFADIDQLVDIQTLGATMEVSVFFGHGIGVVDAIADNLSDQAQLSIAPLGWSSIIDVVANAQLYNPVVTQAESDALVRELMEGLADNQFADIAQIVDISSLGFTMSNAAAGGLLETVDAIADHLSDDAELIVGPQTWGHIISDITFAPQFNPSVTQAEADALVREIMERLADNQFADIAQIVDISSLGFAMSNAAAGGLLETVDAIADHLSDDAELIVGPQTWGHIISDITFAPQFNPSVTQAEADALVREIMERLADNQFADIAQIVDISSLGFAMSNAAAGGLLETVDAIADHLSDDAELIVGPQTWGHIISDITFAPQFNPSVTQAEADALVREIMERLADNQFADIAQIVDISSLGFAMSNAAAGGLLETVDAIADHLSDDAELIVGPQTWGHIISDITFAPQFNPSVTQAEADALVREIMERLADNQFADIAQIVDISSLGFAMENASANANIDTVAAITDNLSDQAQLIIDPSTWVKVISDTIQQSSPWVWVGAPIPQDEADAFVRGIMDNLGDNPLADISQIMDIPSLGGWMRHAIMQGQQNITEAITDNLSDQAQLQVNPADWGGFIQEIAGGFFISPDHTQEEQNTYLREVMEDLADNPLADISQIVDGNYLYGAALDLAGIQPSVDLNPEGLDALLDNMSDAALAFFDIPTLQGLGVDIGTNTNDTLWDSAGNFDGLYGLGGNDFVIGGNGDTALYGGDGVDYVYDFGGADDDIISGGDGADFLYGAGGADRFVFHEGETGVDTIWAFNSAEDDRLNVNDYLDQYDPLQHAIEDFVILTEANGSTTVSVDIDGQGTGGAQDLALLNGVTGLSVDDVIDTTPIV